MKQYERYKPSGIEWIGEIPEHWEEKRLKYSDNVIMGQSPSSSDYNMNENGFPFLQGNAEFGNISPTPKIWCETSTKIAQENDVLLSVRAPIGAVNIADQRYGIGRGLCAIRGLNAYFKFLYYHFKARIDELNSIGTGSTYTAITADEVNNLLISYPPIAEQTSIANYLGRKTAQIDELIAKKRRLIDLLNEEKTAIINQVVTKGLNPNTPMKDSGIPWLGKMPAHWEAIRLKWISKINPSKGASEFNKDSNDLVTFLPMEKVFEDGSFDNSTKKAISELWNGFTYFEEGDVIVAKITPCFENEKGALLENLGSKIGFGSTEFHVLRASDKALPKFLFYLTRTKPFKNLGEALMYGAAGQKRVPTSFLEEFVLGLPPIEEQQKIVDYIDKGKLSIENAVLKIQREIELLQEYRTALISEAVTGKIDVRI